jgi:Arc/MetJ family transcription regulator
MIWAFYTPSENALVRTNIDLDEALIRRAARLTSLKTKREIVHRGLELLVRLKEQERIRRYRGKLRWRGDLDSSRRS